VVQSNTARRLSPSTGRVQPLFSQLRWWLMPKNWWVVPRLKSHLRRKLLRQDYSDVPPLPDDFNEGLEVLREFLREYKEKVAAYEKAKLEMGKARRALQKVVMAAALTYDLQIKVIAKALGVKAKLFYPSNYTRRHEFSKSWKVTSASLYSTVPFLELKGKRAFEEIGRMLILNELSGRFPTIDEAIEALKEAKKKWKGGMSR